jgi:hypothetical protein
MKRIALCIAGSILIAGLGSAFGSLSALAGSKTATLAFGFVESVAQAANGDTVEINGEGTFTLQPKSVSGDGGAVGAAFGDFPRTFTHRDAAGALLATGTWEPTGVLSYRSFGPATPAQIANGGLPPGSEGGKLIMKVALFVDGRHAHDGILTVVCTEIGLPPNNVSEGSLLLVPDDGLNFNAVIHGESIFIRE